MLRRAFLQIVSSFPILGLKFKKEKPATRAIHIENDVITNLDELMADSPWQYSEYEVHSNPLEYFHVRKFAHRTCEATLMGFTVQIADKFEQSSRTVSIRHISENGEPLRHILSRFYSCRHPQFIFSNPPSFIEYT